jgi:hypothetical protein
MSGKSIGWQAGDLMVLISAPIWQKKAALPLPLEACRRGARQLTALRNDGAAPAPGKEK